MLVRLCYVLRKCSHADGQPAQSRWGSDLICI